MKKSVNPGPLTNMLYIVSTSHMDWDWGATFEQYYSIGRNDAGNVSVRSILDNAIKLMTTTPPEGDPPYQYNLAEMAWLQRYLQDNPTILPTLVGLEGSLFFLGGGMTSPDDQVCNGEAFIRTYLVGRNFAKSAGLSALLTDVCWLPDDYGHDPQLPVVLSAMGMNGVGFARCPGWQASAPAGTYTIIPKPSQPPYSLSDQLVEQGVTFYWQAADGSTVLSQYMYDIHQNPGYGVVWDQDVSPYSTPVNETLADFVGQTAKQPGNIMMAPCGGDFSYPGENS